MCIAYCAGRDLRSRPMADDTLVPYDVATNRAHCVMLCRQGIIKPSRLVAIDRALRKIEKQWGAGEFELDAALEDVHMNIERAVAAIGGEAAAGVMHTARSRNDQTTNNVRMWLRDRLLEISESVAGTVAELADLAARHKRTIMAGWTHGHPAMPTTLGHWAAAHAFALDRDLQSLRGLWPLINICPLGAAAGFGSSWPIDRERTAKLLGYDAVQVNSVDAVSTRWEAEARFGYSLSVLMAHLSSLGQDLFHLSSPVRGLLELDPAFTTGSSIMPQKRNPDFAEVTRARANAVQSLAAATAATGRGALSGYNRDSQWTKYWIMDLVDEVGDAPQIFARAVATMTPDVDRLKASASADFIGAVDLADFIAASRGVEFRRLYHIIGEAVVTDETAGEPKGQFRRDTINALLAKAKIAPPLTPKEWKDATDPRRAIERRQSLGSPAPNQVQAQASELKRAANSAAKWTKQRRDALESAKGKLANELKRLRAKK